MSSFRLKDCRKYLKPGSIIILMLDVTGYSIPNPISVLILKLRISSVLPIYSLSLPLEYLVIYDKIAAYSSRYGKQYFIIIQ